MKSRTNYGNWGKSTNSNFRKTTGKLYKGSTQTGPNKTMTSSIPSKYETVIFKFENKKAFGASSVRFQINANENPGPGAFKRSRELKQCRDKQSYSKKGYTNGFASTAQRQLQQIRYVNTGPGPGQYNHKRFNQTTKTHMFLKSEKTITGNSPEKTTKTDFWDHVPGPGHYNPSMLNSKKENRAGFKSRTLRNFMNLGKNPPPNRYRISRALIKKKPFKHRGGTATFAKPTKKRKRDMIEGFLKYRKIKKDKGVPGPGQYTVDRFNQEQGLFPIEERNLIPTGCFKSTALRFGDSQGKSKMKRPVPGPGTYFKEPKSKQKVIVSGCMFMSETNRTPFGRLVQNLGPGHYNYEKPKRKKTHLVKFKERWI